MRKVKTLHEEVVSIAKDSDKYRSIPLQGITQKAFKSDLYVFFIIRKMVRRFLTKGEISEKLLINNIIITLNVFGVDPVNRILRLITDDDEFSVIKTILMFLNSYNLRGDHCNQNRIIKDILFDIKHRYHIQ